EIPKADGEEQEPSRHYAHAPTPWLSALIRYFNQNPMIEAHMSEDQPPDPLTLCHGGLAVSAPRL
ncbi:hypothetical protein L0F63_006294, partial [Massospora cicadina]